MTTQSNWKWCRNCQGLFFGGNPASLGVCSAGGPHDPTRSGEYTLVQNDPGAPGQQLWQWCHKCQGLFFGGNAPQLGVCPARGAHEQVGSGNYTLIHNDPGAVGQRQWQWCHNCQGLFFGGGLSFGVCPNGLRTHDPTGSGDYTLMLGSGSWSVLPERLDMLAVHAALLPVAPAGRVLIFSGSDYNDRNAYDVAGQPGIEHTRVWNIADGSVTRVPSPPAHDLFCCGHAFLHDGRLLAAGGTAAYREGDPLAPHLHHWPGTRKTSIFTPDLSGRSTGRWETAELMGVNPSQPTVSGSGGRWYPTLLCTQVNGAIAMCGHPAELDSRHSNTAVESYGVGAGWRHIGDEPPEVFAGVDRPRTDPFIPGSDFRTWPEQYPRLHLLPSQYVFVVRLTGFGADRSWAVNPLLGISATSWINVCPAPFDRYPDGGPPSYSPGYFFLGSSVLLPLVPPNYRTKILYVGERQPQVIDLGDRGLGLMGAAWVNTGPRNLPSAPGRHRENPVRRHCNTVLLPDGTVLVVGGHDTTTGGFGDSISGEVVLAAELYDPTTARWTTLASMTIPRTYHSVALLLPDGRVWMAGSSPGNGTRADRMEVFSPPYLSRGPRPVITSAPSVMDARTTFDIITPDAASIQYAAIIRCSSVTHGFSSDQRYIRLEIRSRSARHVNVGVLNDSSHPSLVQPGYYMLFIINRYGVPSIARFVLHPGF